MPPAHCQPAAARRKKGLLMIASRAAARSSDELFERWRDHRDPRTRAQLVERFMPLARKLARRYLGAGDRWRTCFRSRVSDF